MNYRLFSFLLYYLICLPLFSCRQKSVLPDFLYELDQPVKHLKLPEVLKEISGLAYAEGNKIYCIQDEEGVLFLYDMDKEEIIGRTQFGESGDYEGIARANDQIFVLRSDGKLYSFQEPSSDNEVVKVKKTILDLGSKCNAEGLSYDSTHHRLLIACKGESKKERTNRLFFAMDTQSDEWKATPLFSLSASDIQNPEKWTSRESFYNSGLRPDKVKTFNPSGIAMHPFTDELYVLSSVGKILVVLSGEYKVKQVISLIPYRFEQPEGIAFDSKGNLIISNEGQRGQAVLYLFSWLNGE